MAKSQGCYFCAAGSVAPGEISAALVEHPSEYPLDRPPDLFQVDFESLVAVGHYLHAQPLDQNTLSLP